MMPTARKFRALELHIQGWKQNKEKLINVNTQRCGNGPKHGSFQEQEKETVKCVHLHTKIGVVITWKAIKYKTMGTFRIRHHDVTSIQGQNKFVCMHDVNVGVFPLSKNFPLPEIVTRHQEEACCFSAP
jgi:hypothetical protein